MMKKELKNFLNNIGIKLSKVLMIKLSQEISYLTRYSKIFTIFMAQIGNNICILIMTEKSCMIFNKKA